jgi:tetratricopeptide (TPR) repeat protein
VAIARDSGAQIVFVSPPSNLRDCSPFKSEHSIQLSDAQRNEFDAMLELAEAELRDENFEQGKHHCEQLLELDASFAQLHFLHGKSLFGLQQWELAEGAFRRALDEDVCPLRATSEIAERIHRVSQRHQVPLVDAESRLRTSSMQQYGHACFGDEYFLDHVHPTIDFNRMIALWILEELHSSGAIDGQLPSDEQIAVVQRDVNATIDGQAQGVAFRNLAKVLHWAGKFDEAIPRAEDALRLLPEDQESRFVLADCRFQIGQLGEARQQYDRLFEIGEYPRAYLPFGEVLSELKEYSEAKDYLVRALLSDRQDHRTRAYYLLGLAHLQLGEFDPAVQAFRESDKAFPNDPSTLALISEAELARGDWQSAKRELQRLTAIEPNNYFAHFRLAEILHQKDVNEEAMWHIDQALRCEPANPDALRQRETIRRALESSNKPGN